MILLMPIAASAPSLNELSFPWILRAPAPYGVLGGLNTSWYMAEEINLSFPKGDERTIHY